jgi:hypothetical protein
MPPSRLQRLIFAWVTHLPHHDLGHRPLRAIPINITRDLLVNRLNDGIDLNSVSDEFESCSPNGSVTGHRRQHRDIRPGAASGNVQRDGGALDLGIMTFSDRPPPEPEAGSQLLTRCSGHETEIASGTATEQRGDR